MLHQIQDIYRHLGDDRSKEIYADRLLFSLTGDKDYMLRIVKNTALYQNIYEKFVQDKREKYIVSAGQWGMITADLFWEFGFSGMIDNYKKGSYRDLPIMTFEEFLKLKSDASVYIASTSFHKEFCEMLAHAGIEKERIVDVTGMMLSVYHGQQYFDLPILQEYREPHEVFVDGGCYDAANSRMFAEWAGDREKTVYAFEPDADNRKNCGVVLEQTDQLSYRLFPKGLWSREEVLRFSANANEGSRITDLGTVHVPVTSIDEAIDQRVTFIKMDIEGAEYEALKGAERTIRRYQPKLAISVYHKPEDIWELPHLILSFYPEYTFYLRHYSLASEETVLYAVAEKGERNKNHD